MKKSNLVTGILYLAFGVLSLVFAIFTETRVEGILWGFSGAGIVPGIMMLYQYFYWTSPKNEGKYGKITEDKNIEQNDELKTKIRDRAGRYAYLLGLLTVCISMLVFTVLGAYQIVNNVRMIVLYLGGYLVFQLVLGIAIFNRLLKKF